MISRLFGCCNDTNAKTDLSVNINANANEPKKIQWSDTLQFIPPINTGQVIKVYDWDTFTLAGHLPYEGSPLYRFSVRLNGIDCLNLKGKTGKHLEDLIMGKTVTLKNVKNEKYGRLLADVFVGDLHVNQYMLDEC
jgi:endonuclease YncB( thermonuclease family)